MCHRSLLSPLAIALLSVLLCLNNMASAQGAWSPVTTLAPSYSAGVMIVLTDGTVIVKAQDDTISYGYAWNKLTPDTTGSYISGTWSTITPMANDRLYFSSQVLQNGKVYVAGGEYGSGSNNAELYDPIGDTWTPITNPSPNDKIDDANSKMLPDGRVLQNIVLNAQGMYGRKNIIYDPVTNSYSVAGSSWADVDESCWTMQPDNSILCPDWNSMTSERYIPALDTWIADGPTPFSLYDMYAQEAGPGLLLPDGRTFYMGGDGRTLYYTPSGDTMPGHWAAGPSFPIGLGAIDACASMLPDGHILLGTSPVANSFNQDSLFHSPTYFYEFDYVNSTYTQVSAHDGNASLDIPVYAINMVNLPDGNILYSTQGDDQYYVYTPAGPQLAAGKPTIDGIHRNGCEYMITGTLFNGISEGSTYGDDWQMSTNYPIVRFTTGGRVYYARTHNWNRVAVQTGSLPDTAYFTLPWFVPDGNYNVLLSANGISSGPFNYAYVSCVSGVHDISDAVSGLKAYPNPTTGKFTIDFASYSAGEYKVTLTDICGRSIHEGLGTSVPGDNSYKLDMNELSAGVYTAVVSIHGQNYATRIAVE